MNIQIVHISPLTTSEHQLLSPTLGQDLLINMRKTTTRVDRKLTFRIKKDRKSSMKHKARKKGILEK
jgi:hypothetical protein